MWIHQDPPSGIRQDPLMESTRIHNWDPPGSTTGIHQDPALGSKRIHHMNQPGFTRWLNNDPKPGSLWIPHLDPPGSSVDPPGTTNGIHQDSLLASTRIHCWDPPLGSNWTHNVHIPGSTIWIHQDLPGSTGTHQDPTLGFIRIHKDL